MPDMTTDNIRPTILQTKMVGGDNLEEIFFLGEGNVDPFVTLMNQYGMQLGYKTLHYTPQAHTCRAISRYSRYVHNLKAKVTVSFDKRVSGFSQSFTAYSLTNPAAKPHFLYMMDTLPIRSPGLYMDFSALCNGVGIYSQKIVIKMYDNQMKQWRKLHRFFRSVDTSLLQELRNAICDNE